MTRRSTIVEIGQDASTIRLCAPANLVDEIQNLANSFDANPDQSATAIELYARFLLHCVQSNQDAALAVLCVMCQEFDLPATNIHTVVQQQALDEPAARLVLKSYYSLWNFDAARCCYIDSSQPLPALFSDNSVRLMAVFGGQPGSTRYLDEGRWLLDVYTPLLSDFVANMSAFLEQQSQDERLAGIYNRGLNALEWFTRADLKPSADYLTAVPVSIPLTGLLQLMQLVVLYKTLNVSPGELSKLFSGNQGVVVAVALSMLTDEQSLYEIGAKSLGILMLVGAVPCIAHPWYMPYNGDSSVALPVEVGFPRPMVSIRGISRAVLESLLAEFNSSLPSSDEHVYLSVVNTCSQFIVSGPIESSVELVAFLRMRSAQPNADQSKVPFEKRKPVISASYIDIIAPYHSVHLNDAADMACKIAHSKGWELDPRKMELLIRTCDDGHDIRDEADLVRYLFYSTCVLPVNWPQAIAAPGVTHIVDFGPGSFSNFGQLILQNVEGRGIPVICASTLRLPQANTALGAKANMYWRELADVTTAPNWLAKFGPQLVRIGNGGPIHIDTRMHHILGAPTVMVAGMTPTTANKRLVAAISTAGYHAELAGGGMNDERDMIEKIQALAATINPGQGITLNCIYMNQRQWNFQFSTLLRLRSEGVPIVGLCIGGGVPSFERALEIIDALRAAGVRHMSFKPSSASAIRNVAHIAQACGSFPIMLQWTGGRAGGHHSFEDFHQPILETYAAIRACNNLALVAGSGFGDAEGSLPYITGDWSVGYGRAPMPFDGILLGSRIMVAKEAGTSPAAKALIVATPGTSNADWHKTLGSSGHGGVTSILTEFGELNHMLATRAVMFVKDMQQTVLNQPREMQPALLLARKDEIIARLNRDYMRPWFGRTADGRVVDLEQMTYAEVVGRAVELMYVGHQQRWIHDTHRLLLVEFIGRCERRLSPTSPETPISILLRDVNPTDYTDFVVELYPESATQLLAAEDRQFFVGLCKRRGQKPPPFIPVLDADFGTLLQKDTIWQSEDLDSVIGCDPQRVGIQQGPVAAQYSTAVDEPVQSILDGIYQGHIAALLKRLHGDDESSVPVVEYIGVEPTAADLSPNVAVYESGTERVYRLPACKAELPELEPWLQALAGPCKSWLYALLMSPALVQGKTVVENYMRCLLRPRPSRTVTVYVGNNRPTGLLVVGSTGEPELKLSCTDNSSIALTVCHRALSGSTPLLNLEYTYCPKNLLVPIHSNKVKEDEAIRRFSAEAAGVSSDAPSVRSSGTGVNTRLMTSNFVVTENHIRLFCRNVKNTSRHYAHAVGWIVRAPLEFVTLPVNCTTLEFLTGPVFGHGQFNMVHLSARIELADSAKMLSAGDVLASEASIASLHNGVAGKLMTITSIVKCRNVDVASITSTFLARGYTVEPAAAFQSVRKQIFVIGLYSATDIAILESKQWFIRDDTSAWIQPGEPVEFCLDSKYRYLTKTVYSSIVTSGSVSTVSPTGRRTRIASVDFQWGAAKGNPVIEYLERHKISSGMFEDGGYSLTAPVSTWLTTVMVPDSNHDYARLSFDGNPIHVNPYVADMAGLPDTITHGLWTSASTRSIVEQVAAGGFPERIRVFQSEFTGMVLPSDNLATELFHVGMKSGRMLVKGTTSKVGGGPVLAVEAEIDQPRTAYVFTGQGSQHVEMGMELYRQSPAARGVWDRANNHMLITYGVNLLEIVRSNPTEHTVCFLGRAGEQIRHNYLALARTPLLPGLTVNSLNFTFHTPTGLLNATQFTQTALVTAALAQVADMRSLALVQQHALFAGHSLGELCALGALTDVFTLEGLLDTVFCRGLIMQSAVQRDAHGSSDYGMVAVNPSRVSSGFGEELLLRTIEAISDASSGLLQIANYNVRGQQYVVSGTLTNLAVLRLVLDEMSALDMSADIESCTGRAVCQILAGPIDTAPVRGKATVPLDGIDMPFHSPMLIDGVAVFRDALHSKINPDKVHADALCQRYIPNLTAKPFELSKEYLELVYDATRSAAVGKILDCWSDSLLNGPAAKSRLATTLLIELLAYQLASPVQWIRTQDHFFGAADVQRVVEIGLSPVLCGMATKTLGRSTRKARATAVLHIGQDHDAIYYTRPEPKPASSPEKATSLDVPIEPTPKLASVQTPSSEPPAALELPTPPSSSAGQPLADAPMSALDVIHAIIAFKMKKPLSQVASNKSIKTLVAGKSTLQNEILGDLQKEFGSKIPDKAEDMSLQELGAAIGSTAGVLGKCAQPLVARMFSSKMPGGFSLSQARNRLQLSYGLGPQRQDALLLIALTMEPAARLATETEASTWLEKAAQLYAIRASISYSAVVGSSNSVGAASQGPAISNAEMQIIRQREIEHVRQQIQLLAQYAGLDLREGARLAEREQAAGNRRQADLNDITAELGEELVAGVRPQFDARKMRRFDSFWNWARQDAYEWIQQAIAGSTAGDSTSRHESTPSCETQIHRLQNCASSELIDLLSGTAKVLRSNCSTTLEPAIRVVSALLNACKLAMGTAPTYRELTAPMQPVTIISADGSVSYQEAAREDEPTCIEFVKHLRMASRNGTPPLIHMREQNESGLWIYSQSLSGVYFSALEDICESGLTFAGKTALVTGCGRGSIGADIVRGLLMGGARVLATTSNYSRRTTLFFENLYRQFGARGSELVVVPFNQGSVQDIDSLVNYTFGKDGGSLNWSLDFVFPFAAVTDIGSMATNLGSHSELAQRVMLTNLLRLLGSIKSAKEALGCPGRPSLVVLPLSPNHGNFGGDGLYGECKLALETTFNRWKSEGWEGYLSIAGAVIGWTRGTGLMSANNLVAQAIESSGVRTFSTRESALAILGLLHPQVSCIAHRQPVWADLDGGLSRLRNLSIVGMGERDRIESRSKILSGSNLDNTTDIAVLFGNTMSETVETQNHSPLAKHKNHFPAVKNFDSFEQLHHLQGMVNLDKVVVVTGYGEVSPQGNAETRWEIEAFGKLTTEGCIELAWIMGLIRHHDGRLAATEQHYTGWVDATSGEPVRDVDVISRYEEYILAHTGIRLIEPELVGGYDPAKKTVLREVQIEHDLEPFETSADEAAAFKQSNGDRVDTWERNGAWHVRFLKGAIIRVPISVSAKCLAAGLVPTGWDAVRFGVPEDIIKQVDPVTLYALVATVEALIRSGITDPYELYQHFHVTEVGSSIGSGVGGMRAFHDTFYARPHDKEIRVDALQEGLTSTVQAWINMLLMSASGPVKPIVGACATAAVAIDTAIEAIQSGKAKVMLAGSGDDLTDESSTEFASMGATSNSADETQRGRTPSEMSRPCTSTRSGFLEGHGGGAVVLMSASAAFEIGAPIYGVIAMSATATDKQGRSVPAPGKGILTSVREVGGSGESPLLDFDYRRRGLERQMQALDAWKADEVDQLKSDELMTGSPHQTRMKLGLASIDKIYQQSKRALLDTWGNEFWKQSADISPLRGSLAVWGLTADDIGVASFHGTSTKANDQNESEVLDAQLRQLGRAPGHIVPAVCQKWLTGHAKGAAASFMLNGILQSLRTGLVPGNRNADNIAAELKECGYSLYPSKSIQTSGIKAGLLKSFGFGQVGAELLVLHPDYALAALKREELELYNQKLEQRSIKSRQYWQDVLVGNHPFVQVKDRPPYTSEQEQQVYLNPLARAHFDPASREYRF